jgi:hypothetical protein
MDNAVRILLLVALGTLLLSANYWFVRSVYRTFVPDEFVIAPFHVVGRDDAAILSLVLASQLRARIDDLQTRIRAGANRPKEESASTVVGPVTGLFIPDPVAIPTSLLEPIDLKLSVGGLEVGGVLSWAQARLIPRATLSFTVSFNGERAMLSGDLGRFAAGGERSVYLETTSDVREVVDTLAYALLRTKLALSQAVPITALDPKDFRTLVDVLTRVDELNRKVAQKHVVDADFAALLPQVEGLLGKVPQWQELIFLAGSIAESAGNQIVAKRNYDRLVKMRDTKTLAPSVAALLDKRPVMSGVAASAPSTTGEQEFMETMKRFRALMQLPGADPAVAFKKLDQGILTLYDPKTGTHEVSVDAVGTPGLPQWVAIMARFFELHYARCLEDASRKVDVRFWNAFRYTLADYLVKSAPQFAGFEKHLVLTADKPLMKFLERLESRSGPVPVQRLALELLSRFDCNWSNETLLEHIVAVVRERGLMAESVVRAVAAEVPPKAVLF